jgi:hypothetical protein
MSAQTFVIAGAESMRGVMLNVWNFVRSLIDDERKGVEVTVKTVSIRSAQANALMWVRLHELAEQVTWHGIRLSPEEFKDLLSAGLMKSKAVPNIDGDGFVIVGQRTSKMSIAQMNELITLIEVFGSERNVKFSADPRQIEAAR